MMSMKDLFYSAAEPLWIVKPPTEEEKKKKQQEAAASSEKKEYSILNVIPDYPYYYPPYVAPAAAAAPKADDAKKETKLTLRVSICCEECVDTITTALKELQGVKDVDCTVYRKKVVVTCTTASAADVLLAARSVFKHARLWNENED